MDGIFIESDGPFYIVTINRRERRNAVDTETADGASRFTSGAGRHGG